MRISLRCVLGVVWTQFDFLSLKARPAFVNPRREVLKFLFSSPPTARLMMNGTQIHSARRCSSDKRKHYREFAFIENQKQEGQRFFVMQNITLSISTRLSIKRWKSDGTHKGNPLSRLLLRAREKSRKGRFPSDKFSTLTHPPN